MTYAQSPGKGLRRFDEHAAIATRLADNFRGLDVGITPSAALAALKRSSSYMGFPLRVVAVIDLLFAWTKQQDWRGGRLPIVWPSNDLLAQKLGVGVRQVQKLLNQAQALGLISFLDSPNGHRGGRRAEDGSITWGYGIVLAPIGSRYAEFAECAARGAQEDAVRLVLRKRIAAARRKVRALAQAATDRQFMHLKADDDLALALMATEQMRSVRDTGLLGACAEQMEGRARVLAKALAEAMATFHVECVTLNDSCSDDSEDTHSTTTNQLQSANADTSSGYPKKSSEVEGSGHSHPGSAVEDDLKKHGISPAFIAEIAPDLCPSQLYNHQGWGELLASAERMSRQWGISSHAFHEAVRVMGQRGAAASVFATLQKYRRGEVHRPGAYLRGMTSKACRGELNLARTLHGLKDAKRSLAMEKVSNATDPAPIGHVVSRVISRSRLNGWSGQSSSSATGIAEI